jgi:hypothetical protein
MPRPSDEQLYGSAHDTPGYGPDQASNFTTSVVAPLDVQAKPQNSVALATLLAKAVGVFTPELEQQARQEGSADEAQGEAAAATGTVDPGNLATGYAVGVSKIQTQATAVQASNAAKQFYAQNPTMPVQDSTAADGTVTKGLVSNIDDIYRQYFPGGEEKLPEQAKVMAPILTNSLQEILGHKNASTIQQNQQQAEDNASALIMHDVQTPGASPAFNLQDQLATLTQVYGGDKSTARDAVVHAIGEAAAHTGQPDIISRLLPSDVDFGGGAGLTPANQAYIDTATQRAQAKQQSNQGNASGQSEMNIVQMVSKGKDPTAALDQYATMPGATPSFYKNMIDWYRSSSTKTEDKAPPAASFDLQSAVYTGQVNTAAQAQQWVSANGYKGQAAVDLMTHAVSALSETQKTNADDPFYKATLQDLDQRYKNLNPMTPWDSPAAKQQHASVMQTYVQNYNQAVSQGKAPADAAAQASTQAQQQWGVPMSEQKAVQKAPQTPQDQAAFIRNRSNLTPSALTAAGINPDTIKSLRDSNRLSGDEAAAAMRALINKGN